MSTTLKKTSFISLPRISVIASHTFTQLVRMKVFYFLVIFALLMLVLQFTELSVNAVSSGGGGGAEQELRIIKSLGFFAMNTFSFILALSATALLIPKDIEDRTLYTILCKPVPRLDYLLGKLFGVLFLIFIALIVMDLLFCLILQMKTSSLIDYETIRLQRMGLSPDSIAERIAKIEELGVSFSIHAGVLAVFLKAAVIASIALLISTFSSSTLFTIIISIIIALIGLVQADAREYFMMEQQYKGEASFISYFAVGIAVFFPDFQFMSFEDGVIDGTAVPTGILLKIVSLAFFYCAIYTVLSWFVFKKKEF